MNHFDLDPDEEYQNYLYNMQQAEDDEAQHQADDSAKAQADLEAQWAELEYQNDCAQQQNDMNEECGELPF
jgi:hypothetical protein